jgi:hypothetical protein
MPISFQIRAKVMLLPSFFYEVGHQIALNGILITKQT